MLFATSCSSIAFWQSDEIDPSEPRELEDFNERFEFIENWETKFKGENTLNNFAPAFSGSNLFFVDPEEMFQTWILNLEKYFGIMN